MTGERPIAEGGRLREFLRDRSEAQALFPGIFLTIRAAVERELCDLGARGVVGELDRETALAREPEAGLALPYDWVAFGFSGYAFYDAHVGVVIDTSTWPCLGRVGFHRRGHLPVGVHQRIEAIDWAAAVGGTPEHILIEATDEHQLRDRARPFDFTAIESETAHYASRAVTYYRAAAPALTA